MGRGQSTLTAEQHLQRTLSPTGGEFLSHGGARVRNPGERKLLQPATPLTCDVECDVCGKNCPVGTPVVCLPDTALNSEPWGCVPCVLADPAYEIAADDDAYSSNRRRFERPAVARPEPISDQEVADLIPTATVESVLGGEFLPNGGVQVRNPGPRKLLQPATPLNCDVDCDICGEHLPAGTPVVCLPDTAINSDPWGCVPCVSADPSYEIAADEDAYASNRRRLA